MAHSTPNPIQRFLLTGFGAVCVAIGFVGMVTPGMPGFVFLLIALWAFRRSNPKLTDWLLNKSKFGPMLRDWEENRSMTLRTKIIVIAAIWLAIGATLWRLLSAKPFVLPAWLSGATIPKLVLPTVLVITLIWLTVFIGGLKTAPESKKTP